VLSISRPNRFLFCYPQLIRREIITHAQLHHPNIIPLLGVFRTDESPLMILPFMENGSASEYLKRFSAFERSTVTYNIVCLSLTYHQSLKPDVKPIAPSRDCCSSVLTQQATRCSPWGLTPSTALVSHLAVATLSDSCSREMCSLTSEAMLCFATSDLVVSAMK
jgi:serine/threonine protein kinase